MSYRVSASVFQMFSWRDCSILCDPNVNVNVFASICSKIPQFGNFCRRWPYACQDLMSKENLVQIRVFSRHISMNENVRVLKNE